MDPVPWLRHDGAGLWVTCRCPGSHNQHTAVPTGLRLSYFFTEFGPNVTTFVYPAEIFPVMVRTTGHGIAAAVGKVGAFIGAFAFPFLLANFHLPGAMAVAAVISLAGLLLTMFTLPEPNQRSLEEISDEHTVRAAHQERVRVAVLP